MELEIRVSEQTVGAYNECQTLFLKLAAMTKEDRDDEYRKYQWMFPKLDTTKRIVNLDDQLGNRKDYKDKFREMFFIVCRQMFHPAHLGLCSYSLFQKNCVSSPERKNTSDRYSQKVILSLGMMGYLTKIRSNYSNSKGNSNHGIIFEVDKVKLNRWNTELNLLEPIERKDVSLNDTPEWRWGDQFQTIMEIKVDPHYLGIAKQFLSDFYRYEQEKGVCLMRDKKFWANDSLVKIGDKSSYDIFAKHKVDDYGGRFYTTFSGLRKEIRHHCITIDDEHFKEVDIAQAQPTFLGLWVKQEYGKDTEWLKHCLDGNFYEWVKKVVGTKFKRDDVKRWIMIYLYSYDDEKAEIMRKKKHKRGYWWFERKFNMYLAKNEPVIYEIIQWHKKNPEWNAKTKKFRNDLSRKLVRMEVDYIKYCLSMLPPKMRILTIHDCISTKGSCAELVKEVMEQCSLKLFGLKIKLKIENGEPLGKTV